MIKKVCILDYGLGNIKSLFNSIKKIGFKPEFFSGSKSKNFDIVFIPGVGSYSKASKLIHTKKYLDFIKIQNHNAIIFGICLGMQLFSTYGSENGNNKGLNFIKGETKKISSIKKKLNLPFVGYNNVDFISNSKYSFLKDFKDQKFYFVHSYAMNPSNKKNILGFSKNQGIKFCSAVYKERFIGTQFHPEKSGDVGLEFLSKFIKHI